MKDVINIETYCLRFMKKLMFVSLVLLALGATAFGTKNYKSGEKIEGEYAPKGMVAYAASYSGDPTSEPQYSTQNSKTFQYLNLGKTHDFYRGDSVKVGIIDSGINYDHEDFMVNSSTKVKGDSKYYAYQSTSWVFYKASQHGYSYIDDTLGHGTNVAATVAAALNSVGGVGLAPNVELYVYKVTNSNNGYEFGAIQNALMDAKTLGLDVINMSFQSYEHAVSYNSSSMGASSGCSTILSYYLNQAYNAGITLVGAAGNYNTSEPSYPGSNNHVINVGSLNSSGSDKAPFSNYGSTIDLVAPGYVYVADEASNSAYTNTQGTSFSAPLVTAAIALYKQKYPSATPSQIETALYDACDPIDSGSTYTNWAGNGKLNVARFLGIEDNGPSEIVINNPEIVNEELTLEVGDTFDLSWTVNGNGTFDNSVNFSTLDGNGTISVDSNGRITALKSGSDYVIIESNENSSVYTSVLVTVQSAAAPKTLDSISVSGQKTSYTVGDSFVKPTVTAYFSDSTSDTVTNKATFSGYNLSTAGNYTVNVSYTYEGVTKQTSYQITVSASQQSQSFSTTYSYTDFSNWSVSSYTSQSNYIQVPSSSDTSSVALIPGIFTDKTIMSAVTITINSATYQSGTNPTSSSYKIYNSEACSTEVTATQTGSLPSSSTYTNVIYTVSQANASNFSDDLAVKFIKPGKYFRLRTITVEFTYTQKALKVVTSIDIDTTNVPKQFEVGDTFSYTGLVVTANYNDSTSSTISSGYSVSQPDMTTTGNKNITVTYEGCTDAYTINVKAAKSLTSISLSGQITTFTEGDEFEFGGTVTAHFNDSTSLDVTSDATFEGFSMTVPGGQMVAVSYTYKGVTESTTYSINVSAGTLSSISVSGQTTEFLKNHPFEFDGTCTATFENGYQKLVTPTSVSAPDMSTSGTKDVTVSYTYNEVNVTTTYQITVISNRVVIETTTEKQEVVLGTITYPNDKETISVQTLTTSTGGYTTLEQNSLRLGSGSNTGSITVTSTTANITKVVVSAKSYGTDTSVTLTVGGTDNTITSSYTNYTKEFSTPVNSCAIATTTNKKRAHIQSITVYEKKDVEIQTDISSTTDCQGLETFIDTYLHLDYVDNLGYCRDSEHHYYSSAKAAFNNLNTHQRSLFTSNSAYNVEWARLSAWASANGDSLDANDTLGSSNISLIFFGKNGENPLTFVLIFTMIGALSIGAYLLIRKKKLD